MEPNLDNANRFREEFEKTSVETNVHVVTDGEKALEFIHQRSEHTDAPPPDLILLERHLSNESSEEILTTLKGDPKLREQPVLVMVSEDAENSARLAYDLNANASIQKPFPPKSLTRSSTRSRASGL